MRIVYTHRPHQYWLQQHDLPIEGWDLDEERDVARTNIVIRSVADYVEVLVRGKRNICS